MEELLTIKEVAKHLKISKATVRRHIKEGKLKAVKIGRIVRISAKEIKSLFRPMGEIKKLKTGFDKPVLSKGEGLTTGDLNWFEECRKLSRKIKKGHGGTLLEDSSETVKGLREGRILSE